MPRFASIVVALTLSIPVAAHSFEFDVSSAEAYWTEDGLSYFVLSEPRVSLPFEDGLRHVKADSGWRYGDSKAEIHLKGNIELNGSNWIGQAEKGRVDGETGDFHTDGTVMISGMTRARDVTLREESLEFSCSGGKMSINGQLHKSQDSPLGFCSGSTLTLATDLANYFEP